MAPRLHHALTGLTVSFCYVVLCHTDAGSALALASRIRQLSATSTVVLRHDREDFISADDAAGAGAVLFRSRLRVRWGGWSMVAATLEVLEHARRTLRPSHVVLLSGHDYPVTDLATWESQLEESGTDALLKFSSSVPTDDLVRYVMREPAPAPDWVPDAADRAAAYLAARAQRIVSPIFTAHRERNGSWAFGTRRLTVHQPALPVRLRRASQWMTLSASALDEVLDADEPTLRFFSTVRVPDELFFSSLLSDHPRLTVVDRLQTWTRFPPGAASPDWIKVQDIASAARTGAAFVRKVPPRGDDVRRAADQAVRARQFQSPAIRAPRSAPAAQAPLRLTHDLHRRDGHDDAPGAPPSSAVVRRHDRPGTTQ